MKEPFEECPRFNRCNANYCLLDPNKDKRDTLPGEDRCSLGKKRRMSIASKYPDLIPWRGLKPREASAMKRWEMMSEEDKKKARDKLAILRDSK